MNEVSLNNEQRLYVLKCASGYSCLGFEVVYSRACKMAEDLATHRLATTETILAPAPEQLGTIECYELYQKLLKAWASHPASKKTWFEPKTPKKVQSILNHAITAQREGDGQILRLFYGDHQTGRDWCQEWDMIGFVGRTSGMMKSPILMEPYLSAWSGIKSVGAGGAILCDSVVRIINVSTGHELYRTERYQVPQFSVATGNVKGLPIEVSRIEEGKSEVHARFESTELANEYIAYMQGHRIVRPFKTEKEYRKEFQESLAA